MNDITARAYVVSRLGDDQLKRLHEIERAAGGKMSPSMIHERFNTVEWGSIEEAHSRSAEAVIMAIYRKIEAQWTAKMGGIPVIESDILPIQHEADITIRRQDVKYQAADVLAETRKRVRAGGFSEERHTQE